MNAYLDYAESLEAKRAAEDAIISQIPALRKQETRDKEVFNANAEQLRKQQELGEAMPDFDAARIEWSEAIDDLTERFLHFVKLSDNLGRRAILIDSLLKKIAWCIFKKNDNFIPDAGELDKKRLKEYAVDIAKNWGLSPLFAYEQKHGGQRVDELLDLLRTIIPVRPVDENSQIDVSREIPSPVLITPEEKKHYK